MTTCYDVMKQVKKRVWKTLIRFKLLIMLKIRHFSLRGGVSWKRVVKYLLGFGLFVLIVDISGVLRHPFELDYHSQFAYPLDHPNFVELIENFRNKKPVPIPPINTLYADIPYNEKADNGCGTREKEFRLIVLIKSAPHNFERRSVIRATWGNAKRFSDIHIKIVFLLGQVTENEKKVLTSNFDGKVRPFEYTIKAEMGRYQDMVRADFMDSYYNNTYKTMMGIRWLGEICSNFRFALCVDDDMYVSIKNLLKFVRNPTEYPEYWEKQKERDEKMKKYKLQERLIRRPEPAKNNTRVPNQFVLKPPKSLLPTKNNPLDFDIDLDENAKLYAGYVFFVPPHRHKLGTKWFLPLEEYPFNYFPPYVPAGSIIMSKPTVMDIYYASFYVKHFRFDDIYIGIICKKMGIEPYHTNHFRFWPAPVKDPYEDDYIYLVTSHGFDSPKELRQFWEIQKSLGHA